MGVSEFAPQLTSLQLAWTFIFGRLHTCRRTTRQGRLPFLIHKSFLNRRSEKTSSCYCGQITLLLQLDPRTLGMLSCGRVSRPSRNSPGVLAQRLRYIAWPCPWQHGYAADIDPGCRSVLLRTRLGLNCQGSTKYQVPPFNRQLASACKHVWYHVKMNKLFELSSGRLLCIW